MESLVNYESDDGDKKYKKKKVHAKEHHKSDATTGSSRPPGTESKHGRKRKGSSDDSDSSDGDTKAHHRSTGRRESSEESIQSPKRTSAKNKNNGHEKGREKSSVGSNSERDGNKCDGKRRKDDRSEKKREKHGSRDRRSRSHSRGHDDRHHKEKHKSRDKYEKRDRHDDRSKSDRRDKRDRRSDERKSSYKHDRDDYERSRDRKKDETSNGASNRTHSPKRDSRAGSSGGGPSAHPDHSWHKESPSHSYQSDKQPASSTNQFRPHHDDKDSRTKFAMQKAEAISRSIERRANEKMHQLQKLGIEVPGITAMSQLPLQQPLIQQPPLMPQNTHIRFGSPQPTATVTSPDSGVATAAANVEDNGGINLANFTSPVLVNPRYTEQMQKKKLIWGAKKAAAEQAEKLTTTNKWETAKFSQDSDGKMASKFLRLMGAKGAIAAAAATAPASSATKSDDSSENTTAVDPSVRKRQEMFSTMEQQYEVARQATHTMRGMGLGFGSSRPY